MLPDLAASWTFRSAFPSLFFCFRVLRACFSGFRKRLPLYKRLFCRDCWAGPLTSSLSSFAQELCMSSPQSLLQREVLGVAGPALTIRLESFSAFKIHLHRGSPSFLSSHPLFYVPCVFQVPSFDFPLPDFSPLSSSRGLVRLPLEGSPWLPSSFIFKRSGLHWLQIQYWRKSSIRFFFQTFFTWGAFP